MNPVTLTYIPVDSKYSVVINQSQGSVGGEATVPHDSLVEKCSPARAYHCRLAAPHHMISRYEILSTSATNAAATAPEQTISDQDYILSPARSVSLFWLLAVCKP